MSEHRGIGLNHRLRLLYTRSALIEEYSSHPTRPGNGWNNMSAWAVSGDWHIVTVDTNVDEFPGLDQSIALDCAGSYNGGTMTRIVELSNYSEILFEHCVKNGATGDGKASELSFYIDGVEKLRVSGPSPWQRIVPIGIAPGKHELKFIYSFMGTPNTKAGIVDTLMLWEGRTADCLITEYTPPKPLKQLGSNKVLRGFTRYQEMAAADTEISFTAVFEGKQFIEFMQRTDQPFYFVDEFGICYRGIFPEAIEPESIAMNAMYSVELTMVAGQKTGIGIC